ALHCKAGCQGSRTKLFVLGFGKLPDLKAHRRVDGIMPLVGIGFRNLEVSGPLRWLFLSFILAGLFLLVLSFWIRSEKLRQPSRKLGDADGHDRFRPSGSSPLRLCEFDFQLVWLAKIRGFAGAH